MKKSAFKTRVFAYIISLVILMSFSFLFLHVEYQNRVLDKNLLNRGIQTSGLLANDLKIGLLTGSGEFLAGPVNGLLRQRSVLEVSVFDRDGRLMVSKEKVKLRPLINPAQAIAAVRKSKTVTYVLSKYYYEFWAPVLEPEGEITPWTDLFPEPSKKAAIIGYAKLCLSREGVIKNLDAVVWNSIIMALVFMAIGGLMAYLIAARISRPLKSFISDMNSMKETGIREIQAAGDVEISAIAAAFNEMAGRLKKKEFERLKADREREKALEMFHESQKLNTLSILSGGIAHDFNNILGILRSNLELVRLKAPDDISAYLSRSLLALERGGEMVKNLLASSRRMPSETKILDIGSIVTETIALFHLEIEKIRIEKQIMPGLWPVRGDHAQIQQVIINLLLNAKKAVEERFGEDSQGNGLIIIRVDNVSGETGDASGGSFVRITVEDNGIGMNEETMARIFDPFFTTKKTGFGIGLSALRQIIKQHGGRIEVKSQPSVKTAFQVFLPRSN